MTTNPVIDQLRSQRDEARDTAITLAEADNFDPESESFRELEARSASLDTQIERLSNLLNARASADALDGKLSKIQRRSEDTKQATETRESAGDLFVRSEVFQAYTGRGTSARFEIQERALPMSMAGFASVLGTGPQIDLTAANLPPLLLANVNTITVSGNAIEYVSYAKTSGGADVVDEGDAKPSAEWAPTVTPAALDNIAVYTQMTRQLIEDSSAVRSFIDGELGREVIRKAESEAVAAVAGVTLPTAAGPSGTGITGAIRAAKGKVQAAGFSPNAVMLHADDAVDADLASMDSFRGDVYWGLTPVINPGATKGTVVVGDFVAGVHHYTRSGVSLYISDSHGDTFTSNIFTLLAEQRSKTVVVRPGALSKGTKTA
jgi:HK97 family phage major capsid protein